MLPIIKSEERVDSFLKNLIENIEPGAWKDILETSSRSPGGNYEFRRKSRKRTGEGSVLSYGIGEKGRKSDELIEFRVRTGKLESNLGVKYDLYVEVAGVEEVRDLLEQKASERKDVLKTDLVGESLNIEYCPGVRSNEG